MGRNPARPLSREIVPTMDCPLGVPESGELPFQAHKVGEQARCWSVRIGSCKTGLEFTNDLAELT